MSKALLLFHTLRFLKPVQIYGRVWFKLYKPKPSLKPAPEKAATRGKWIRPPLRPKGLTGPRTFDHLNREHELGNGGPWQVPGASSLWNYHLHYFDDLMGEGFEDRRKWHADLIRDWINENPVGSAPAWDSYPISKRIVNWIKADLTRQILDSAALNNLAIQARYLSKRCEHHLQGNHLWANAKALIFAGLYFKGEDAEGWLSKGIGFAEEQLAEQILPDGGHFERSPMYHTMILEDCLDLINLLHAQMHRPVGPFTQMLEQTAVKMAGFLKGIIHPDSQIALFNDAAFGIELPAPDIFEYCEKVTGKTVPALEGQLLSYPDTGYYIMAPKSDDRMLIDCGPVGPDYQPGHAHCDTLSFELSLNGRRVVVDSGCFQYEGGPIRKYNRGNAGHNTVTIDGENQSEVWGAHRCARRARPIYAKLEKRNDGSLYFEGAHDGYKRLTGRPIHHRRIRWFDNGIDIDDWIEGKGQHNIESRLHIHPDLSADLKDNSVEVVEGRQRYMTIFPLTTGLVEIKDGWYCPEFGLKYQCSVIVVRHKNVSLPFKTGWQIKLFRE
ncbi:MAG: heparinase [Methanosarcinales archaeon]|nr:MAG: heparinase [Methanosarcinales archaeon]